jgi:Flp pilus assembly protein TadB
VLKQRDKLVIVLPVIAAFVIVLVYYGLFSNPLVIAVIFVLWLVVRLANKRKFDRQVEKGHD